MPDNKDEAKPMTTQNTVVDAKANEEVKKSQAAYKNGEAGEHSDLVTVKIIKDGDFYKKGDTDIVHPTMALILKQKGLIADEGKPYERPKFDQKDVTVDA